MDKEITYIKTEDGKLQETQPEVKYISTQEFSREAIDEQVSQWTISLAYAQENLDLWTKRQGKADEKGVVAQADIAVVDTIEPLEP